MIAKGEYTLYVSPVSPSLYASDYFRVLPIVITSNLKLWSGDFYLKFMSDMGVCPHCNSENVDRVRREGREDWVLDRVYLCADCGQRSGRVPAGNTTSIARIFVALRLI